MNAPTLKSFPRLMEGRTVMYVHGFGSSAQSGTVRMLQTLLPNATVIAYDLPVEPHEAMALLREKASRHQPDLIIGTSMGGMYAEQLKGYNRILVNPAFQMADTMKEHGMTGLQRFQNPRQDGIGEFLVNKQLVKSYKEITEECFTGITEDDIANVWGLFGDADDKVHTHDEFLCHYPQAVWFHGGHRLTDSVLIHSVLPIIRRIDDKLCNRERRTLIIDFPTLHDSKMQPASSMLLAVEHLMEHYNLYFFLHTDSAHPERYKEVHDWLENHIGTGAFNRFMVAESVQMLLGDYLVSREKHPDFMGTSLLFGSDDMKTWEEVITFFERLGGQ